MSNSDATALLLNVCSQLNLGEITIPPEKLTGGALHQNWKITTSNANYVIKKLNSQIAQKPGIKEKYEETEQIASKLHASGIPAIAALKFGSHFVHHVDEHFFIVYPFVEGKIISLEELQLPHIVLLGRKLDFR